MHTKKYMYTQLVTVDVLSCTRKPGNTSDRYTVAVLKDKMIINIYMIRGRSYNNLLKENMWNVLQTCVSTTMMNWFHILHISFKLTFTGDERAWVGLERPKSHRLLSATPMNTVYPIMTQLCSCRPNIVITSKQSRHRLTHKK